MTRAFGDFECKIELLSPEQEIKSFVICEPEIREVTLNPEEDEFVILASDGLYDRATSQEAVTLVRNKLMGFNLYEQDP